MSFPIEIHHRGKLFLTPQYTTRVDKYTIRCKQDCDFVASHIYKLKTLKVSICIFNPNTHNKVFNNENTKSKWLTFNTLKSSDDIRFNDIMVDIKCKYMCIKQNFHYGMKDQEHCLSMLDGDAIKQ